MCSVSLVSRPERAPIRAFPRPRGTRRASDRSSPASARTRGRAARLSEQPLGHFARAPGFDCARIPGFSDPARTPRDALVHPVFDDAGRRIVAVQVIDRRGHLQRPLVSVPTDALQPLGIDDARAEHAARLFFQCTHFGDFGIGRIAEERRRLAPAQARAWPRSCRRDAAGTRRCRKCRARDCLGSARRSWMRRALPETRRAQVPRSLDRRTRSCLRPDRRRRDRRVFHVPSVTIFKTPVPYAPGLLPKMRKRARRRASEAELRCAARLASSARVARAERILSAGSRRSATSRTARSSKRTTPGKASRKNPEMRTVTSTRARPSSASGITSRSITRPFSSCHTGRTPSSHNTSAMSSPWVRMFEVPQTVMPIARGGAPSRSHAVASSASPRRTPTVQAKRDGIGAHVDGVKVAPRRQDVGHPARRRTARPGRHVSPAQAAEQIRQFVRRAQNVRARCAVRTRSQRACERTVRR